MEDFKTPPEVISFIDDVSRENGIANKVITDVKTNQKGEGYFGQIFTVSVKDEDSDERLELVIKAAFTDDKVREMVPIRIAFENEIFFYKTVYPTYEKLETLHATRSRLVPVCLKASEGEKREMLALENLRFSGFEIFDKTREFDRDHVGLIFTTYGRLHGYSYVLRDQQPSEYQKVIDGLHDVRADLMKSDFFLNHLLEISKTVRSALIPGEDDEVIEKFQKYTLQNIADIFGGPVEADCPAILHGDCWSNNMMFKYQETSGGRKPTDMRLIDWQIIKVGSPVYDLSYCLYSGASKEVYDNLAEHLRIYHNSFSACLKELGSDPDKLFPFAKLEEHWKKFSKWGMMTAFSILRMKLTRQEDIVDLTDDLNLEEFADVFKKSKFDEQDYNKRVRSLLRHMHEIDAL